MRRSEGEYDYLEGNKYRSKRPGRHLKPGFTRKPYQYTKAESKKTAGRGDETINNNTGV